MCLYMVENNGCRVFAHAESIGDMDMTDLDFVDFYEVEDEPETLEIRVRGRLKRDLNNNKEERHDASQ